MDLYKKLRKTNKDIENLQKGLKKKEKEKTRLEQEIKNFYNN
jgi:cell division protein FtsB